MLSIFERDLKEISKSIKTPDPYEDLVQAAIDRTIKVNSKVKREMFKRGIMVYESSRDTEGICSKYMYRGYHGEMNLLWELIKAECGVLMREFMGLDMSHFKLHNVLQQLDGFGFNLRS